MIDLPTVDALRLAPHLAEGALLRATIIDRLVTAQSLLPRGRRLLITGAFWPGALHGTGAAVDLTMCTGADDEVPVDADGQDDRQTLAAALGAAGMVNYPTTWWHWSYGDPCWALVIGAPAARYGSALPMGFRTAGDGLSRS